VLTGAQRPGPVIKMRQPKPGTAFPSYIRSGRVQVKHDIVMLSSHHYCTCIIDIKAEEVPNHSFT